MLVFLLLNLNVNIRVRIIVSHFANCEVNSSYCGCKVVNHTKIAKQFFSRGKFNSSRLCLSTSYPYFIHSLHYEIQIFKYSFKYCLYPKLHTKWKKCFAILEKHFRLRQGENLATFGIFTAK